MSRPIKDIRAKVRADTKRYQVQFCEHPGHWFSTPEKREDRAIAWAERNKDRLIARSIPTFRALTVDFFKRGGPWEVRMGRKAKTFQENHLDALTGYLENHLIPSFGNMLPSELRRRYIDDTISGMKRLDGLELAPPTKQKITDALRLIMEELVDQGIVERNPCDGLVRYSSETTHPRTAIPKEALEKLFPPGHDALVATWGSQMFAAFFCYLHDVGCRPGEARALTWGEWNSAERFVSIRHGIRSGTTADIKGTKTGNVRPAFVSVRAAQELAIWREQAEHREDGDFVFSMPGKSNPVSNHAMGAAFRHGLAVAGYADQPWTPYYLRHSFGTHYLDVLDDKELMVLMGHSSIITSAVYRHPDDDLILSRSKGLRDKLDGSRK